MWTVPSDGTYEITAAGAVGGATPNAIGGKGRVITSRISLTQGETIKLLSDKLVGNLDLLRAMRAVAVVDHLLCEAQVTQHC